MVSHRPIETGRGYWLVEQSSGSVLLRFPGLAEFRFDVERREVLAEGSDALAPGLLAVLVTGNVLNMWLVLRGELVLHASAVAFEGHTIAFCGDSGSGKSTLAGQLCSLGAELITDDLLRVEFAEKAAFGHTGSARLRLRDQAAALAAALGGKSTNTADGRTAVRPSSATATSHRLDLLVWPYVGDDVNELRIESMRKADTWNAVLSFPRMGGLQDRALLGRQFDLASKLADSVPSVIAWIPMQPAPSAELGHDVAAVLREALVSHPTR